MMRYAVVLSLALSLPIGCSDGRELFRSEDKSVWVEEFRSGGHEVKIKRYLHNELGEGDLVGLYTKKDPDPYIEFRLGGSTNGRVFIDHPKREGISKDVAVSDPTITVQDHVISTDKRLEVYESFRKQIEEARTKAIVREE